MKVLMAIADLWGLIYKVAIVIIAIVAIVAFVRSCAANASLDEHSSCQQFEQADTATQDIVVQNMQQAHNDTSGVYTAIFSIKLYCSVHGDNAPIDGIYNASHIHPQFAHAHSRETLVDTIRAWSKATT